MTIRSLFVGLIVFAALASALWNSQQYNDMSRRRKQKESGSQGTGSTSPQDEECEADLWLVIPCKRIQPALQNRLCQYSEFSAEDTINLVNDSVYFLAIATANNYSPDVPYNNDWQAFPEGGDLLVQLRISDGGDLIDEDLKRSLSRAIDGRKKIFVKQRTLLNDLNNLEKFHRA